MQVFVCDKCNHVDAVDLAYPNGTLQNGKPRTTWLCTMCQTGKWHDKFEYQPYRPEFDLVVNRPSGIGVE